MNVNTPDPLGLQVKVAGLERRVRYLEFRTFGEVRPERYPGTLGALYVNALMGNVDYTQTAADLWNHVVLSLDEEDLLFLGRSVDDPFPWRPLILVTDNLCAHGFSLGQASEHLLDLARSLMNFQGLGMLIPEDILGWITDPSSALSAI